MASFRNYYDQLGVDDDPNAYPNAGTPASGPNAAAATKPNALLSALQKSRDQQSGSQDQPSAKPGSAQEYANLGDSLGSFSQKLFPSLAALRRGGIVSRPTIALMGEAGPEAVIPLSKPEGEQDAQLEHYQGLARRDYGKGGMPESPDTLNIQVSQLKGGSRRAVLIGDGAQVPERPAGIRQMKVQEGVIFYRPEEISPDEIKQASSMGTLSDILGGAVNGYGSVDKTNLRGPVSVVTSMDHQMTPIQDVATDNNHLKLTLLASKPITPKGGRIVVHSPIEALRLRVKSHLMPKMASGGLVDEPTDALVGEAGPEAVIPLSGDDASDQARLDMYRKMLAPDPQKAEHMKALENELENRNPNYVPDKPKWWQYLLAGGAGALGGYNNTLRNNRPVDMSSAEQAILYPGLGRKKAQYEGETARLQGAYGKERQAELDKSNELAKAAQFENITSSIQDRMDRRGQAQQAERNTFSKAGGQFQTPLTTGMQAPPQVMGPPAPQASLDQAHGPEPPQVTAPSMPEPPAPASAPPVIITGGRSRMSGFAPPDSGYTVQPSAPYDKAGTRRVAPTIEYQESLKEKAERAKAEADAAAKQTEIITPEMASALPELGLKPLSRTTPETLKAYVEFIRAKQKDPNLHIDKAVNEENGDVTYNAFSLDPTGNPGKPLFTYVERGAGKKRQPVGSSTASTGLLDREVKQYGAPIENYLKLSGPALDRLVKARESLQRGDSAGDATGVPEILTALISGNGTGIRITKSEIQSILDGQSLKERAESWINKMTSGTTLAPDTRAKYVQVLAGVEELARKKRALALKATQDINNAVDRGSIISTANRYRDDLEKMESPLPAAQGPQSQGGYIKGHIYGGMVYNGGDPNQATNWTKK